MSIQAPVVASKTQGPSQVLEFWGGEGHRIRFQRTRDLLTSFAKRFAVRLVELKSLIGTLQFACKAVDVGRTFLRRMINLTRGLPSRFHHTRLNKECCGMEWAFLFPRFYRNFLPDLELYTVATSLVGFGGYFNGQCMVPGEMVSALNGWKFFAIAVVCALWFPHFSGKRIQFWYDNESVNAIINSGHSKATRLMELMRFLVLLSMKHNFFVRARHVPGVSNDIADALSGFQDERFRASAPKAQKNPVPSRLQ